MFNMDSTVEEILGKSEGIPPSNRVLELIGQIIAELAPDFKWYVDRSYFNDRVDITVSKSYEVEGASLLLNEDTGYYIH
ncbi:hypothetical protein LCGC14_2391400, partial [marine sediment metagenome]